MTTNSNSSTKHNRLNGLIAAPFTPMLPDKSVNWDMIPKLVDWLAGNGVTAAFICGTTGEGFSLSTEERMRLAECWLKSAANKLKVVVHVAHNSLDESRRLAAHAEQNGADAIASIGPTFFRPNSVEQLVDFCAPVAAAAPGVPFYYYHMPAMTGVNLPMIDFLRHGSKRIPNLAGIKFTDENLMSYTQCLNFEDGRFNLLFGRDEILLAALALGATGAVGSTYNYAAPLYVQIMQDFAAGNLAAAETGQAKARAFIDVMNRYGGLAAGKAIMKFVGVDCGPVRLPLRSLTPTQETNFRRELEQVGFFGYASKL